MKVDRRVMADGSHSFIVFAQGRKYLYAIAMGSVIRIITVDRREERHLCPVLLRNEPYPVKKAARLYLRSELPKTKRAGKALRQLLRKEVA